MKVLAKITLHAYGTTKVTAEGSTMNMMAGDSLELTAPGDIDIEVEHPELLGFVPMPHKPDLWARLGRFRWRVRKAWSESR